MPTNPKKQTYARREFLQTVAKRSAVLAGLVAAAHLPYKKPSVQSFFGVKNAYAQATNGVTYTISGQVTDDGGGGLDGVAMSGLPGSPVTAGGGFYTDTVPAGFTGTVTPTLAQYTFVPPSASWTNLTSNQTQDFVADPFTINISGQLGPSPPGTSANIGQDAYTFVVPVGVTLTIAVTAVELHAEIGLFAPGDVTTGTNLLTGTSNGLMSAGVNQPINTTYGLTVAGTYTIAIEDERANPGDGPPDETSGTYTFAITTTQPLGAPSQIITNGVETLLNRFVR